MASYEGIRSLTNLVIFPVLYSLNYLYLNIFIYGNFVVIFNFSMRVGDTYMSS